MLAPSSRRRQSSTERWSQPRRRGVEVTTQQRDGQGRVGEPRDKLVGPGPRDYEQVESDRHGGCFPRLASGDDLDAVGKVGKREIKKHDKDGGGLVQG